MRIKLYSTDSSSVLIQSKNQEIYDKVEQEAEDYILNVGEETYIDYLKAEFELNFPEILFDDTVVDSTEEEIEARYFPNSFDVQPNNFYKRNVITFEVPYSGEIYLLKFRGSQYSLSPKPEVDIDSSRQILKIRIIDFYNDSTRITDDFNNTKRQILDEYRYLKNDIDRYNNNLENTIKLHFQNRKQKTLKKKDILNNLGFPLKKTKETSSTYSVPSPKLKEKIKVRPQVSTKGFTPEPSLDDENYSSILKIINDVGKNFERMPSVYKGKGEEDLRDHILMVLDPNFELGSASGETFNFSGKTDIQLRNDSSVVFIAECKFWTGIKGFNSTIDQLLGYLTWRDSKTSLIIFVDNKDFTNVLNEVKGGIKKHPNFVSEKKHSDESWLNYTFNLPNDTNKEIKLAVQLYHLPK